MGLYENVNETRKKWFYIYFDSGVAVDYCVVQQLLCFFVRAAKIFFFLPLQRCARAHKERKSIKNGDKKKQIKIRYFKKC